MPLSYIPFLPTFLMALVTLPIGYLWFSPMLFGKRWGALSEVGKSGTGAGSPWKYVAAFAGEWIIALMLSFLFTLWGIGSYVLLCCQAAFTLWFTLHFIPTLINYLFERRPLSLLLINTGHQLVNMLAMSAIWALWWS